MAKFNRPATRPAVQSPITTATTPTLRTFNGAPGFERDTKSELFLLGVSNMVGEDTFYEKGSDRDDRFKALVQKVAVEDPQWTTDFLRWLRSTANMRSAPVVGALEAAAAMVKAGIPGSRALVASVLQRADEPGEALAYWTANYGRKLPKPVKRGIADACTRLYTEHSMLKYDTGSKGMRFADVIQLVHAEPKAPWQSDLFKYAMARRLKHTGGEAPSELLAMVQNQAQLRQRLANDKLFVPSDIDLSGAGMTWEDTLSLLGNRVSKAALWEAQIPSMGYMALLRNLRNFDEAHISKASVQLVIDRLTNPAEVARSKQFPYRFLAAYEAVANLRWSQALDEAMNLSLRNLPELPGRSLVLIDTSASMQSGMSAKSKMSHAKAAAVFGVALAMRNQADLYGFASGVFKDNIPKGASLISEVSKFLAQTGCVGHGTEIALSLQRTYQGHDRVFVISDMQTTGPGTNQAVPANVMFYGFNLAGYRAAAMPAGFGTRHELGGLNDATFKLVPILEAGRDGHWPWEQVE